MAARPSWRAVGVCADHGSAIVRREAEVVDVPAAIDHPSPTRLFSLFADRHSESVVFNVELAVSPTEYALDGRAASISAPDTVTESVALATELRQVAERNGDTERVANALDHLRTAQVMAGDLRGAEVTLTLESRIANDLRQPFQMWQVYAARAMLALAAGRLSEAEELVPQAFAYGEHVLPAVAIPVYRLHRHALCDFQGRLEEVVPRPAPWYASIRPARHSAVRSRISMRGSDGCRKRSKRSMC